MALKYEDLGIRPKFHIYRIVVARDGGDEGVSAGLSTRNPRQHNVSFNDIHDRFLRMRDELNNYARNRFDPLALQRLAKEGHKLYHWFLNTCFYDEKGRNIFRNFVSSTDALDRRIEFESEGPFLPIDTMYIGDPKQPIKAENFLGLRMSVVKRVRKEAEYSNEPDDAFVHMRADPSLAFAFHDGLLHHRTELQFFAQKQEDGRLRRFLQTADIRGAEDLFALWAIEEPYDIIHISSHMEIRDNRQQIRFAVGRFTADELVGAGPARFSQIPWLVFLNCCTTASLSPLLPTGFLSILSYQFAHGFIATKTDVPDKLASDFSIAFYDIFLGDSVLRTIGDSLMEAQRSIVKNSNDYTVLAYSLFNIEPDFFVARR